MIIYRQIDDDKKNSSESKGEIKMLRKNFAEDYGMKMVDYVGEKKHLEGFRRTVGDFEISEILYFYYDEDIEDTAKAFHKNTDRDKIENGFFVHDLTDTYHDGDMILLYDDLEIDKLSVEEVTYALNQAGNSNFCVDADGIFHLNRLGLEAEE